MRFRAEIQNMSTFTKFIASLASLGDIAWLRLDCRDVRFTVIVEGGTQLWSVLTIDTIFETYTIQSAMDDDMINLEVPLVPLLRALKSAQNAIAANIRLTKKDGIPLLSLTIITLATVSSSAPHSSAVFNGGRPDGFGGDNSTRDPFSSDEFHEDGRGAFGARGQDRETIVVQDIPVRVLAPDSVQHIHEPVCREPEVHIDLPNLYQLKAISDRFTRLAALSKISTRGLSTSGPKLELSANMHGCLRLQLKTDSLRISSLWTNLRNPELDPAMADSDDAIANHPSTRMKELGDATGQSDEGWATVRIDGKDWGRVLSVGRLGANVIACFVNELALVLYVYMRDEETGTEKNTLTYYVSSYSA